MKLKRAAIILLLLTTGFACRASAATSPATPEQIDEAIKRGVAFLYGKQANGHWERAEKRELTNSGTDTKAGQFGGRTALVTYALLAADQSPQDAHIVQAVNFLRKADMIGTYAIAMRAQVWNSLPTTPENKQALSRDSKLLLSLCKTEGDAKGFYGYVNSAESRETYDHSASQYGVLGCWACAENLEDFPPGYWNVVDAAWRSQQLEDGSWSYTKKPTPSHPANLSMTAAGVATLFVTQGFLNRGKPTLANGNLQDPSIAKGLSWISRHFNDVFDLKTTHDPFYTLFGIERIGLASGYKYFDTINWYQAGADYILSKQNRTGGFSGANDNTIDTAFALLFLSRGRSPITMNKLQYEANGKEAPWNQRPRDLANLTRYISKQTERELNWQVVNLKGPVQEMHDSPILYIAGSQDVEFNEEQRTKLRQYVEQGGLIVAQADGGSTRFGKSTRALGSQLFPQYEFRVLPAEHQIFTGEQFPASKFKKKPNVMGLSNGTRELMLLLPDDPARAWQPMDTRARADDFQLGADIFLYAIDKQNLLRRGQTYLVTPNPSNKPTKTISLARLEYDGNWDPEPGGWKRLATILLNTRKMELKTTPIKLGSGALKEFKLAHVTGTTPFTLEEAARNELKDFVNAGGTLIVDSAGGGGQFSQSVETEMDAIFGEAAKTLSEPLPSDSPLYRDGGKPIEIAWRAFAKAQVGSLKGGRLRAIKIKDRLAVIYSPEDLSVGLVGQPVDGINGYEPKTATALMINALLYASGGK